MNKKKEKNTSKTLGIISIIAGILSPIVGIILAVIGLSISKPKNEKKRNKAITLNIVGMGVSVIVWMVAFLIMLSNY